MSTAKTEKLSHPRTAKLKQPERGSKALAFDNGLVVDADGFAITKANSVGMYIARRAFLDETDKLAAEMEAKWGCDRLRLLVDPDLRERFDRQRYLLNQATWYGELEDVKREATRMATAWRVLDQAADAAGAPRLDDKILEVRLSTGIVVAICADIPASKRVTPDGRAVHVYLLDEIARLLEGYPGLAKLKDSFPGATVTEVRRRIEDPLLAVHDSQSPIDQISEDFPF
jgi:hypothetical protein